MLRILIANDTYPPQLNGAAVSTQRLAFGLANRGHQVAVVAPNASFDDAVEQEPTGQPDKEATVYRVKSLSTRPLHPQFRVPYWPGVKSKVEQIFKDLRPDIVHIQSHFILGRGCLRLARQQGIPIIGTNHFMPETFYEYIPGPLRRALAAVMWRHWLKSYNRLDCVVAPSHACLDMLREVGLMGKARVISNGIDLKKFQPVSPPEELFARYGIRRDRPTFLAVGRLERDKNVELVIRATAGVATQAKIQTVIVGKGKDEAEFRNLAHQLDLDDVVKFTGFVPDEDLPHLYAASDVYIGAGAAELQGIAVMEAMATGLPILAANAVALPELVDDGENGHLFALDEADLAGKMSQMLAQQKRWALMGKHSLARIQDHDAPNTLAQLEDLYCETINAARQPGSPAARQHGSTRRARKIDTESGSTGRF